MLNNGDLVVNSHQTFLECLFRQLLLRSTKFSGIDCEMVPALFTLYSVLFRQRVIGCWSPDEGGMGPIFLLSSGYQSSKISPFSFF